MINKIFLVSVTSLAFVLNCFGANNMTLVKLDKDCSTCGITLSMILADLKKENPQVNSLEYKDDGILVKYDPNTTPDKKKYIDNQLLQKIQVINPKTTIQSV
jgi:hypothetical protein